MSFRTTILFFSFVVLSLSANLFNGGGLVAHDEAYNATLGPFNVYDTATLTVKNGLPVYVCIVSDAYGLPHWTQYSEENCFFYYNSTGEITAPVALRNMKYKIGVYFSSKVEKGDNTTVAVTLIGDVCTGGSFYDGINKKCVAASVIDKYNTTISYNFAKGETKFWTFENPSYVGAFKWAIHDGELSAETSEMWARWNGVPSKAINDAFESANSTVTFEAPRPGTWVFGVHSADGGNAEFYLSGDICSPSSSGANCHIHIPDITNNANLTIKNVPMYFRVKAVPAYPFLVSITTNNGSNIPHFFAAKGNIPTGMDSTDVPNCNNEHCDVVRSITFNVTAEEDWYVAIINSLPGNVTFGIWWNQTCVVGCINDNHGQCADTGRCECEIDFEGIDCSISKGLGPQYIVLIIIASLVVASAIIGFVAWAYMRRKRANYEIVS